MIPVNVIRRQTPSWVIFLIDLIIVLFALMLAYLLRFNFSIPVEEFISLKKILPLYLIVRALGFVFGKTYRGIVRYTSIEDAERIFLTMSLGSVIFIITNIVTYFFVNGKFFIPFSIIVIELISSIFILTTFRILVKMIYYELNTVNKEKTNVIIYGTGDTALITKRTLERDMGFKYKIVAYIDNTKRNKGKKLEGVTIYHSDNLEYLLSKYDVSKVIIAKKYIGRNRKKEIIETCLTQNVIVLSVPAVESWINGELSYNQIKTANIEDLLERSPIKLDVNEIRRNIVNSNILVTGAAGSIGSEIVRQLTRFNPNNIILYDKAESELYDLELELKETIGFLNYKTIIGDINDLDRLDKVFKEAKPSFVFHAAAYKHVPMMENNPSEALKTNILGTKIIADISDKYNVSKFVMVSTDKAVNPTSVMGASKRIAEIYIQTLNKNSNTSYITTRFGNVLGSNGSVIPRFKKQIEKGGPVTVTHPDITRFFMTIPEACQLVLEAGVMGSGGEVFIFDMGKPVKIVELAKKMIKLSGLTLGTDIQLQFTGLRSGEKLYEELLLQDENNMPTHNSKIMIAKIKEYETDFVNNSIDELIDLLSVQDYFAIVEKMKNIVPEYKSKNSIYEKIDLNTNKLC